MITLSGGRGELSKKKEKERKRKSKKTESEKVREGMLNNSKVNKVVILNKAPPTHTHTHTHTRLFSTGLYRSIPVYG